MITLSLLLLLFQAEGEGFVLERDVELVYLDTLDRKREIHRRERVSYQAGNLLVEDLTFGEKLLVRSGEKSVWVIDTLAGTWSKLEFDEIRKRQSEVLSEISGTRKRVPGTADEKSLTQMLEGYGRFDKPPSVELRTPGKTREVLGRSCSRKDLYVNGNIRRISVYVDPSIPGEGYLQVLSKFGAFSKEESDALKGIGGLPVEGVLRYVHFLDRVLARIRVTSVRTETLSPDIFQPPTQGKEVPLARFEKPVPRDIKPPGEFLPDGTDGKENR